MADDSQDAELLKRINAGDSEAFHDFVKLCWSEMKRRCSPNIKKYGLGNDVDESDLALSEFNIAYQRFQEGKLADVSSRKEFMDKIGLSRKCRAISRLRKKTAKKRGGSELRAHLSLNQIQDKPTFNHAIQDPAHSPESKAILREREKRVMSELGPIEREIAELRREQYTYKQIAEKLSLKHGDDFDEGKVRRICGKIRKLFEREDSKLRPR